MSNFWPSGLDLKDTDTVHDILQAAQKEWQERSLGQLVLLLQDERSSDGHQLYIIHAKHVPTNRILALFRVKHLAGEAYPASIQPREDKLPNYLRKTYYEPGPADYMTQDDPNDEPGRIVTNKWVANSPAEFRNMLHEVFNLDSIKSALVAFVSTKPVSTNGTHSTDTHQNSNDSVASNGA